VESIEKGVLHWPRVMELADVIAGRQTGRASPDSITLFKSLGIALEDISVAARLISLARERQMGAELPI
jgi:ornithine cyclodeaminase/alanine dehydrogenase-like protein (mu-crystallin family)